jgi:hypothetical protein
VLNILRRKLAYRICKSFLQSFVLGLEVGLQRLSIASEGRFADLPRFMPRENFGLGLQLRAARLPTTPCADCLPYPQV